MTNPIVPVGYEYLRLKYDLKTAHHFRKSFTSNHWEKRITNDGATEEHQLPASFYPGDGLGDHLEFALKYEGLHLELLTKLFAMVDARDVVAAITAKPTGQYRRKIWFLYEMLRGHLLPIPDLKMGAYIPVADETLYVVTGRPKRSPRHRILDNLLGSRTFCPLVRKTECLLSAQQRRLDEKARETMQRYPPDLLARAVSYLYRKETKSSFQIEQEEPNMKRAAHFIELLRLAARKNFVSYDGVLELQNAIVDPRFAAKGYRDYQNYVGESRPFGDELVHYVCPKPEDVASLMTGLFDSYDHLTLAAVDPVIIAAIVAFGFVFIHPFEDGNGRIHRFLIHNILARSGFAPEGVIFPVSASMLQQLRAYDETLETFSRPLLSLLEWDLDEAGKMTVRGESADHYRYIDFTTICERLYEFVADTVDRQLPDELNFLARYDAARKAIRLVVDMPDRLVDLFVKVCASNRGRLSDTKRHSHFKMLSDAEVGRMEAGIQAALEGLPNVMSRLQLAPDTDTHE